MEMLPANGLTRHASIAEVGDSMPSGGISKEPSGMFAARAAAARDDRGVVINTTIGGA